MSMCVSSKYTSIYSEQIYARFHREMEKDENMELRMSQIVPEKIGTVPRTEKTDQHMWLHMVTK